MRLRYRMLNSLVRSMCSLRVSAARLVRATLSSYLCSLRPVLVGAAGVVGEAVLHTEVLTPIPSGVLQELALLEFPSRGLRGLDEASVPCVAFVAAFATSAISALLAFVATSDVSAMCVETLTPIPSGVLQELALLEFPSCGLWGLDEISTTFVATSAISASLAFVATPGVSVGVCQAFAGASSMMNAASTLVVFVSSMGGGVSGSLAISPEMNRASDASRCMRVVAVITLVKRR